MSYLQRPTIHTPVVDKIKRSEEYYLPSGDIIFLVENYLYRVHRYFFERESPYFRQRFSAPAPPGQVPKGSSDSNPFPLEETTAVDFNRFLWVFYNPKFNIYETGATEWLSILKLACTWGFDEVKRFAVRELETKYQEPLDKIRLYHRYEVDKLLLVPSYIAMALRPEPLSLQEGRELGLETALLICRAREFARGSVAPPPAPGEPPLRAPGPVALDVPGMEALIRDLFLAAPPASGAVTPTSAHPSALPHVALTGASPHARSPSGTHAQQHHAPHHQPHHQPHVPPQPAANLFVPPAAPARDLADIWSSPTTPTVVDSGAATPAAHAVPEPRHEAPLDPAGMAPDVRSAEEGAPAEEPADDSWFGMGGKKKKAAAAAAGRKAGVRA